MHHQNHQGGNCVPWIGVTSSEEMPVQIPKNNPGMSGSRKTSPSKKKHSTQYHDVASYGGHPQNRPAQNYVRNSPPTEKQCYGCKQDGHSYGLCPQHPFCTWCGKREHQHHECYIYLNICYWCQQQGHTSKFCPPRK